MRAGQAKAWLWSEIEGRLFDELRAGEAAAGLAALEQEVAEGLISSRTAAARLLDAIVK